MIKQSNAKFSVPLFFASYEPINWLATYSVNVRATNAASIFVPVIKLGQAPPFKQVCAVLTAFCAMRLIKSLAPVSRD